MEQKNAIRGQRDKMEASAEQLGEKKKGIKLKQEMLSSSTVPSVTSRKAAKVGKRLLRNT